MYTLCINVYINNVYILNEILSANFYLLILSLIYIQLMPKDYFNFIDFAF